MGGTFYIFKSGNLKRKDNNIVIQSLDGQRKNLKSETTDEIYLWRSQHEHQIAKFSFSKGITIHVFNYYGFYSGSFYPRESNISGYLLVQQVKCYDSISRRLELAKRY